VSLLNAFEAILEFLEFPAINNNEYLNLALVLNFINITRKTKSYNKKECRCTIIKDERCSMKKPNKGKKKLNQGLNLSSIEMHARKLR